ncbi:MAG: MarC family protein [archaeon GBS-70-058]|nr:MarC family protein [Candidatus Culexarchaeum nevadense]
MLGIDPSIVISLSIQLFAIMDPLAAVPTLLDAITNVPEDDVEKLINKAALTIFILINVFTIAGWYILSLFGISMPAFKVAAGIILMAIALDTLITGHKPEKLDIGAYIIVPIATPLIVGPGTMTLLLTSAKIYGIINTLIASYIAFTLTYLTIRNARRIVKLTGETFIHGLGRFMSIIIASFAIEMMISGINEYMGKQS